VCGQILVDSVLAEESAASERAGFAVGATVAGRYKIKKLIGQGGVGTVYEASDKERDVNVALKAISPNLLQTEEERRLFSVEMKAARKLSHPNIVKIFSEGAHEDRRFFTMKLLDGLTLRKVIQLRHDKGQSFAPEEILPIFHQIASALDYAHRTTWHGDLKPENIIILPDVLKITDFHLIRGLPLKPFLGIVKAKSKGFSYVAPELRVESNQIDGRSDVFSLGVILAEILTGVVFDGQFTRLFSTAMSHLPKEAESIIRRSLQEHPDNRFNKVSELVKGIDKALQDLPNGRLPPPVAHVGQGNGPSIVDTRAVPPPPPASTFPGHEPVSDLVMTSEDRVRESAEIEIVSDGEILPLDISDADNTLDGKAPLPESRLFASEEDAAEGDEDEETAVARGQAPLSEDDLGSELSQEESTGGLSQEMSLLSESGPNEIDYPHTSPNQSIPEPPEEHPLTAEEGLVPPPESPQESDESVEEQANEDMLLPPPLPDDDIGADEGSFDSLPPGVLGVPGQALDAPYLEEEQEDGDQTILAPPPMLQDEDDEDDDEPTFSGRDRVGIYDELTALKQAAEPDGLPSGQDSNEESREFTLQASEASEDAEEPILMQEHGDALERSSPRLHSAEVLAPPTAVPKGAPAPALRPVTPPRMTTTSDQRPKFIAAAIVAVLVILVGIMMSGDEEEKQEVPIVAKVTPGEATIGKAGGEVTLNGLSLDFPPNAVEQDVLVKIEKVARVVLPGYQSKSIWYRFTPEDLPLKAHVRVHFPFQADAKNTQEPKLIWVDSSGEVTAMAGIKRAGVLSVPLLKLGSGFVGIEISADPTAARQVQEDEKTDGNENADLNPDDAPIASKAPAANDAVKADDALEKQQAAAEENARKEMEKREEEERQQREAEARKAERLASQDEDRSQQRGRAEENRLREQREKEARQEKLERDRAEKERKAEERRQEEEKRKEEEEERQKVAVVALKCPKGMARIDGGKFSFGSSPSDPMRNFGEKNVSQANTKSYCIDYYEYPNSSKKLPKVGVSYAQAKRSCSRRGKRLCTEKEWERACKGPKNRRFPYGNRWNSEKCNTESEDGEARELRPAKSFKKCRSGYNIFAMSGNAEEWTADSFRKGSPSRVVKGGAADRPDWASRCASRRGLSASAKKPMLGFRCCADPE
jgi:serine/threonine protein kinase